MEALIESINNWLLTFGMNLPVMIISISLAGVATIGHVMNGGSLKVPVFVAVLVAAFVWSGCGDRTENSERRPVYQICLTEIPRTETKVRIYYRGDSDGGMYKFKPSTPTGPDQRWCVTLENRFEYGSLQFRIVLDVALKAVVIRATNQLQNGGIIIKEEEIPLTDWITTVTILKTVGPVIRF
jgi:hypothetical protein